MIEPPVHRVFTHSLQFTKLVKQFANTAPRVSYPVSDRKPQGPSAVQPDSGNIPSDSSESHKAIAGHGPQPPGRGTELLNVKPAKAFFIKLGEKGEWEKDCIETGILRIGYREVPHEHCTSGDWDAARDSFPISSDPGSVTRHINQVRQFYQEPESTLWITFFSDRLWWCFATPVIEQLSDRTKIRPVSGEWCDTDNNGKTLIKGHLSGKLLAVQSFQGTICAVRQLDYLIHKIMGTSEPHVAETQLAVDNLVAAVIPIIKNLHPKDLETLTDLIFRQAGWQRTGVAGEVEKDIDLELLSPITDERIAVQVKSKASASVYRSYQDKFADMRGFSHFYFVTHSPDASLKSLAEVSTDGSFIFWGPEKLALQAVRNGLVGWLIDRAS